MSGEVVFANAGERGVVQVTLRHAGRLNAMSRAMWRQLREVFEGIQQQAERGDDSVRCVLIAGEGGAFCA
ncbi:MAG: enoyl-CoA hydratase/isomerase family protein, partial [Acidovorax sp.]